MQAVAEAVAVAKAQADEHFAAGIDRGGVGALGHEEDFRGRNLDAGRGEEGVDFGEVGFARNDELELKWVGGQPLAENFGAEAGFFVKRTSMDGLLFRGELKRIVLFDKLAEHFDGDPGKLRPVAFGGEMFERIHAHVAFHNQVANFISPSER